MEGRKLLQYIIDTSDVVPAKKQEATEYLARLVLAAQHSVQADLPCTCRITRGYVRRINPACQIHGDKSASR